MLSERWIETRAINRFAFMAMENPSIQRWQYQKGPFYGRGGVEEAVSLQQDGHCLFCSRVIDHYHHVQPRHKGGSEPLPNRVGLCNDHHKLVHTDAAWAARMASVKAGLNKKYGALSVLNQIIPYLSDALADMFPGSFYVTNGFSTKRFRDTHGIPEDHNTDAYCIACSILKNPAIQLPKVSYELHKFRRHDRAAVSRQEERKYYLDGKLVTRNRRKRMEQTTDSLEEFRAIYPGDVGRLTVQKGVAKYKDTRRILPGAVFLVDGKRMVLQGRHGKDKKGNPIYLDFYGHGNFRPKHCKYVHRGSGWQFV